MLHIVPWGTSLRKIGRKYKKRVFPAIIAGGMVLIIVGYALFQLKVDSANGRLLIWKVSVMAIVEKPLLGHGTGNLHRLMEWLRKNISPKKSLHLQKN